VVLSPGWKEEEVSHRDNLPLDTAAVGALLGLTTATITKYISASKRPDRRYSHHPFPIQDGFISGAPYWFPSRINEILTWAKNRPGQGSGGGRPSHKHT